VYDSGEAKRDSPEDVPEGGPLTRRPHLLQNRAPAGRSLPQASHVAPKRVPQAKQKFDPGGLLCWHRGHFMPSLQ
jgi:hypothetical protein